MFSVSLNVYLSICCNGKVYIGVGLFLSLNLSNPNWTCAFYTLWTLVLMSKHQSTKCSYVGIMIAKELTEIVLYYFFQTVLGEACLNTNMSVTALTLNVCYTLDAYESFFAYFIQLTKIILYNQERWRIYDPYGNGKKESNASIFVSCFWSQRKNSLDFFVQSAVLIRWACKYFFFFLVR